MKEIINGVYPTMITPYQSNHEIDYGGVAALIDFYAENGCQGVFAVCQSSEMHFLSLKERTKLAEACVNAASGRLRVIASGHVSAAPSDQIEELTRVAGSGVDAVVLVSNRMADKTEGDRLWIENAELLVGSLPDSVPLGIYECPHPYKRLLSDETIAWCRDSGRFSFIKDTCCDADLMAHRSQLLEGSATKLFNANSATLLETLRTGAAGFSGVMANMHPDLYVWLCANYARHPEKAEKVQSLLSFMSYIESDYPVCAKEHARLRGLPMTRKSRSKDPACFSGMAERMVRQLFEVEEIARALIRSETSE